MDIPCEPSSSRTSCASLPFLLTREMQNDFYEGVICNRAASARFWSVLVNDCFVGMVGLVNISLENRSAEISIVMDPETSRRGYGSAAVDALLEKGLKELNLDNVYGECYVCNPAIDFWEKYCTRKLVDLYLLPNRKFYEGRYHNSLYFNFTRGVIK
jgi:hypothetical protein